MTNSTDTRPDLLPCPKCGVGKGEHRHNLTPAQWIECDTCGFMLGAWESAWNQLSAIRSEAAATIECYERALNKIALGALSPGEIARAALSGKQEDDNS